MTRRTYSFAPPELPASHPRIYPVFLSFQGCPNRCVFCSQELQSGQPVRSVEKALADLDASFPRDCKHDAPGELAFYGGTFTALPLHEQKMCLALAQEYKENGLIAKVRASTRPDAVTPRHLKELREAGLDMLELGVQSFCDTALSQSSRGYTGSIARDGCRKVQEAGLTLGVQLMPGMPGMDHEAFLKDIEVTTSLSRKHYGFTPALSLMAPLLPYSSGKGNTLPGRWMRPSLFLHRRSVPHGPLTYVSFESALLHKRNWIPAAF